MGIVKMTLCPRCSSPEPVAFTPDGIWYALDGITPRAIAYRCGCGTNRSRPWAAATHGQRIEAGLAQLARDGGNEITIKTLSLETR
jgi:hypothetical protein